MNITIESLISQYTFHDSSLDDIRYDVRLNTLTLIFENFPFWMQNDHKKDEPENALLKLVFHGVKKYDGPSDSDESWSVDNATLEDEKTVRFFLTDEINNKYTEMTISADNVEIFKQ